MNHQAVGSLVLRRPRGALFAPLGLSSFLSFQRRDAVSYYWSCIRTVRYFSTKSRKRHRRTKSLTTTTLPATTRIRLRQMVELNQLPARRRDDKSIQQLVSVATQRMEWLQTTIYRHWNPDYQPDKPTMSAESAGGSTSVTEGQKQAPRRRIRVVMDARWWFWNIMFALMPAAVIALYCEFRVHPAMEAFYAEQDQHNQRMLGMGMQPGSGSGSSHPPAGQATSTGASESKTSWSEGLHKFWTELQLLFADGMHEEQQDEDSARSSKPRDHQDHVPEAQSKKNVAETATRDENPNIQDMDPAVAGDGEAVTMELLLRRLEQLERLMGQNPVQKSNEPGTNSKDTTPTSYPQQSGIRTRIHQRMREAERVEQSAKEDKIEHGDEAMDWIGSAWNSVKSILLNVTKGHETEHAKRDTIGEDVKLKESSSPAQDNASCNKQNAATDPRGVDRIGRSPPPEDPTTASTASEDSAAGKDHLTQPWWKFW